MVRPQKRRRQEQQRMLESLRVGDEVLTAGGIYGRITRLRDDEVTLEIAPQLGVRVARLAVAGVAGPDEPTQDEPEGTDEPAESQGSDDPPGESSVDEHGG
jgi:preprotein translocase subunit YajC